MTSRFAAALVFCALSTIALRAKDLQPTKIGNPFYRIKTPNAKIYTEANKAAPLVLEAAAGYMFEESGLAADEKFDRAAWVYLIAGFIEKSAVEPGPTDLERYDLGMATHTCAFDGKVNIVCKPIQKTKKKKKPIEFDVSGIKNFLNSTSTCNDPQRTYVIEPKLSEIDSNRKGPKMADYVFYVKKGTRTVVQLEQNHSPWECH